MTASENLRVLSDAANFHGPASESRRFLEEHSGDAALLLARALDALAAFTAPEPDGCDADHCGHSDYGLGHAVCGCPYDSGVHIEHTCGAGGDWNKARAILADADRLFGNDTEKEER